ncbi:proto-oncogene tyrosine-protein kinase ROS [Cimex lectularius]|uniref:Tyrosine-protein kinase receptor n=1 Tax=Cimex lectularius TaxID=79782 RepID=A0A8I6THB2_CIMLE|nr:proto-oncogene tyrosine-protein kinase ROS [Cimex lectularius]
MEAKLTCYLVVQALALVSTSGDSQIEQCKLHCPLQNRTRDIHYEVGCSPDCKIAQCLKGCTLWEKALEASCQTVCNGTQELLPPKELYCVMGCNDALNRYLQKLKDELGRPPPPALVADSLTSTSLKLEWERGSYPNLTALLQWSYADAGQWQYARNQSWNLNQVNVSCLRPYTNYRFRVSLLAQEMELVMSEASLVIGTLPSGLPSSPPSLVRATATDPTRVSVSWLPGPFPNGPILSYVVSIDELPHGYKAHKDIPVSEKKEFYMFQSLLPSRNYSVSVAMRNAVGLGPPAVTMLSTPSLSHVKKAEKTILILGAHHTVISQAADMLDEPVVMYETQHRIRGVAVHIRKGLLFVSDSLGRVMVTSARGKHHARVLLGTGVGDITPHALSVDWLNDQLYILGEVGRRWQVARCELDGSGMIVALAGLLDKPLHMEIDPYNGYLFWVMEGVPRGGLYRLDIADISNGIKHEVTPDLILQDPDLGAFTVDHTNFRILVSSHSKNTVLAVSLDGKEVTDLRHNTQKPQFEKVLSLTMANGLFYWTNGDIVLTEEYHTGQNSYFHNLVVPGVKDPGYVSIGVDLPSAQPVPAPVNPPTGLQAVMGAKFVRATWNIPHLLGGQGKGAWQNWSYQLSIEDLSTGETSLLRHINSTSAMVQGLMPGRQYFLKTAAATSSGVGPWSGAFTGTTLTSEGRARLIWSSSDSGLLTTDPTGQDEEILLHSDQLQGSQRKYQITGISWYEDQLYLVTNGSGVLWYNVTTRESGKVADLTSVGSIAVDWVGKKLYWSNPKQQLIARGSLKGNDQEPLPILTVAKELNIDSTQAYIYWSTGHAVECARLNGKHRRVYYPAELFSGKQVMGLTLDTISRMVFWIVRNYEGSTLFRAEMANGNNLNWEVSSTKISLVQHPDILGPLVYFDNRLIWLRDDKQAVIGDLLGSNSALLNIPVLNNLNVFTVIDETRMLTDQSSSLNAIPESIKQDSIRIVGNYSNFNISWDPVTNVNIGEVFYELKISHKDQKEITVETVGSTWSYPSSDIPPPYSSLEVSVRALTYWGVSAQVSTILYSPETSPSQPSQPRAFVVIRTLPGKSVKEPEVVFRWDPPLSPNGIIIRYTVVCWLNGSDTFLCNAPNLDPNQLSFTSKDVPFNVTVFFQVRACTESGCGLPSRAVMVRTGVQTPIPRLLLTTNETLTLTDVDRGDNTTLAHNTGGGVTGVVFHSRGSGGVYWIQDSQTIVHSSAKIRAKHKILSLNGTGLSLAIDWVSNTLFWTEMSERTNELRKLDLTHFEHDIIHVKTLLIRPSPMLSVQINPLTRSIYWFEESTNKPKLWQSSMDGTNVTPFFKNGKHKRRWERSPCSCPSEPHPGPQFTIDHISGVLIWSDVVLKRLMASDLNGCHCTVLMDNLQHNETGLPPSWITSDQELVYWSNSTENRLYSLQKRDLERYGIAQPKHEFIPGLKEITAFGNHLQPYPDLKCLIPRQPPPPPSLTGKSSDSLTLLLSDNPRTEECWNISQPNSFYTVYYQEVDAEGFTTCTTKIRDCKKYETLEKYVTIDGLNPYSEYIFMTLERNYYSDLANITLEPSIPVVFQTAPGAPSPPEEVMADVLSPNTLLISWDPPRLLNSDMVSYEVLWTSDGPVDGMRQRGEQVVPPRWNYSNGMTREETQIHKLSPGANYLIWVRAYSENAEAYSESKPIEVSMFPEPNNLTLVSATAYSLNITWQKNTDLPYIHHKLEYVDSSSGEWSVVSPTNSTETGLEEYLMVGLKPKTVYTFRIKIIYKDPNSPFLWPQDNRFTFKTLGDRPSKPGVPVIQHLSGEAFQVAWEPSKDNGSPVQLYWLEGTKVSDLERTLNVENLTEKDGEDEDVEDPWKLYFNGTDNFWIVSNLESHERYKFRVRSQNDYGWSDFSESSGSFDLTRAAMLGDRKEITIIIWIMTPAAIILTLLVFMCVLYRHERVKKWGSAGSGHRALNDPSKGPDVELASLRQIPRWSAHVQSSNILYTGGNLAPVSLLPHLRRDQITLSKFLGSGAFGEVFEGQARNLPNSESDITRVAVKTLRKGANDQEKAEFLKEAQLMSNFRHAHILQLLGVCLDNDPHFIIMELMEGGDLLSYLRASRPLLKTESGLTLIDLLSMCVDVAKGCCYLEEMHFVHRDLACRNCLVSSRVREDRIVKIGDFGLARDIYKNDYYRKEGEGLLPVRWMSPESLVDGVFTCQSDVWAFGVLLWEIMSLGQQPYPARNNLEVLYYVRNGGRLSQPTNSNVHMYDLMIKCWNFNPEERPTFKYCLDVLEEILKNTEDIPLNTSTLTNCVVNKRRTEDIGPINSQGIPKYLELLYDSGDSSGYEIPKSLCEISETTQLQNEIVSDSEERSSLEKLLPVVDSALSERRNRDSMVVR